jgi:hypothetical protein
MSAQLAGYFAWIGDMKGRVTKARWVIDDTSQYEKNSPWDHPNVLKKVKLTAEYMETPLDELERQLISQGFSKPTPTIGE